MKPLAFCLRQMNGEETEKISRFRVCIRYIRVFNKRR